MSGKIFTPGIREAAALFRLLKQMESGELTQLTPSPPGAPASADLK